MTSLKMFTGLSETPDAAGDFTNLLTVLDLAGCVYRRDNLAPGGLVAHSEGIELQAVFGRRIRLELGITYSKTPSYWEGLGVYPMAAPLGA
ncbi:Uncharacterised protein [Mycobacteroides abscessus subsp. abscessus]|nr:Uncharacterised protein [Mycobacteroides abscessus subsp. abscessus]SHU90115.1 Uncharacterised protein [Mycobacteroides abscessus subsp. abscessus]SHW44889.1 Uncharacterised protein [Mycobacteroides abscessus subsp. abscessus]SIH64221.1 Uncharacterised protein [Mycobacteroides abscessus subsp. abscessus]SIL91385.1 Uncharacterised protein [Mycobacteroides abscessus subsp. abscessus]